MAGEVVVTIIGNLADAPELRFTQGGVPVASIRVGSTNRIYNKQTNAWDEGETVWVRCTAWRDLAENVASSLTKGTRVIVTGRLKPPSAYQSASGEARASLELEIDEIGPSLRFAQASVTRKAREGGDSQSPWNAPAAEMSGAAKPQSKTAGDDWANPAVTPFEDDETPF